MENDVMFTQSYFSNTVITKKQFTNGLKDLLVICATNSEW